MHTLIKCGDNFIWAHSTHVTVYMASWNTPYPGQQTSWPQKLCTIEDQKSIVRCGALNLVALVLPDIKAPGQSNLDGLLGDAFADMEMTISPSKTIDSICG